jgi:hypothetical protein
MLEIYLKYIEYHTYRRNCGSEQYIPVTIVLPTEPNMLR